MSTIVSVPERNPPASSDRTQTPSAPRCTGICAALATSAISEMELIVGCRNNAELQAVEQFLKQFQVVKVNEAISTKRLSI